jgi:sigma-B regulation protein RsbU (phosphoserine phosphatase)
MEQMGWLFLYGQASVFIYVFIEIVVTIKPFRRAINKEATRYDQLILMTLFGGFSIFGTYIGVPMPSGAIMSIRDLGPMFAGITAGPIVGLMAGLMGGIHRYFLGGFTGISCGLATVVAGLLCGAIHSYRHGKIIGILQGVTITTIVECVHMGIVLLIARPFEEAMIVVQGVFFPMVIANSMGMFFFTKIVGRDQGLIKVR